MKFLLVAVLAALALVVQATPRPVVLYHGMGDNCCNPGSMGAVKSTIEKALPGVYVHSIMIGKSPDDDTIHGFLDNANRQIGEVCAQLKADPKLAGGFNAVGFSQGGQFMRAYVQRCNDPPVYNLVTMGSQHEGVIDIPGCVGYNSSLCKTMTELLAIGAYAPGIREELIQAQYFNDPYNQTAFLQFNPFLPDINNEHAQKNATYKQNLSSLNKLALFEFTKDITVVPRESSIFSVYNGTALTPMRQLPIYQQDWIGLQTLDKAGKLDFGTCPGGHMQFTLTWFVNNIVNVYFNNNLP